MDPKPRVSSPRANPSSSYSLPMLNYFDSFTFNYIFRYFPILKVGHSLEIDLTFFLKKKTNKQKTVKQKSQDTLKTLTEYLSCSFQILHLEKG